MQSPRSLIQLFTEHKVASNLLMIIMILLGIWGLTHIHTQINPPQNPRYVRVDITWPGASAEDVERLITQPVEYQFRTLDNMQEQNSNSFNGGATIWLRFDRQIAMGEAVDNVKQQLGQVRDLPSDMESPIVKINQRNELVAMVMISGDGDLSELALLAKQYERELLERGIDKVSIRALPEEEIAIQISSLKMLELGASLDQIAAAIANTSSDVPFGSIGQGQNTRQLRSLDQQRDVLGFSQLPIKSRRDGDLIPLGEIADIQLQARDNQVIATQAQRPVIVLRVMRAASTDTLEAAQILKDWREENKTTLSQGIEVKIFLEAWLFAKDQINLVVKNGLGGLLLVIVALLVFLNGRVAWWVMLGIPVSFVAAIAVFYSLGGTINIISMTALVMALGIVVDDAIVVGEHSLSQFEKGLSPEQAASSGASRMFSPVMASSLTTMAAFLPLMIVDSEEIREIPMIMLLVILASIVECFLIMPGHLRSSFAIMEKQKKQRESGNPGFSQRFREKFDRHFSVFRDQKFLPVLRWTLANRRIAISLAVATFAIAISLLISGRVKPELNLNIDFDFIEAGVQFTGDVTAEEKSATIKTIEAAMARAEKSLGGDIVVSQISYQGMAYIDLQYKQGYQYSNVQVELISSEHRSVTLDEFVQAWRDQMPILPFVEELQIQSGDQFWSDLSLHFKGDDVTVLKAAAEELQAILSQFPGVSNIYDDLPFGQEQWIFKLTGEGRQLGLTPSAIGRQIYAAYEGYRIQMFNSRDSEIEVRVKLPDNERNQLSSLRQFPILTAGGEMVPLSTVATIESRRGINVIPHINGKLAVNINASIDKKLTTAMTVISELEKNVLPDLLEKYDLSYGLSRNSAEEGRALNELLMGAAMGMLLIYLILAWIFSSYTWPLAVMIAIPLALTGALMGLQLLNMNLGVMAIMGLFTLAGVIVNDSIILVSAFKENREMGMPVQEAIEKAALSRLRAVILTSLTTTLGLVPMMLESSPMGAVMAPLAVVICFGILYGTLLILMVIPALLCSIELRREAAQKKRTSDVSVETTLFETTAAEQRQ